MIILPSSSFRLSSDVGWHIRDKLRPVPKHSSVLLYVHGNHEARYGTDSPGQHLDSHTAPELWLVRVTDCLVRRPNNHPSTPLPTPMLGCTFLHLIKHTFLSSWRVFVCVFFLSQKVAMIWNFWKVAINFYDSVNPLWVSSRFSHSKHNELWSRRHCIKSVTVQFLWPVMLHQRLQLKQNKNTDKKLSAQKYVSKMDQYCPQFFVT